MDFQSIPISEAFLKGKQEEYLKTYLFSDEIHVMGGQRLFQEPT
jgi:hypothetical protein